MMKKIISSFVVFVVLLSLTSCNNDIKAEKNSNLNNFLSLKEKELEKIEVYGDEITNENIIKDYNHEFLNFLKTINFIEQPEGITNTENYNLRYGNDYRICDNYEYLTLFSYQLVEITAEYQHPYSCKNKFYGVTEEDGKRIVEKAKELI